MVDQAGAGEEGEQEEQLQGQQPGLLVDQQVPGDPGEDEVDAEQVEDQLEAQAQGSIPYFSKRR